jgi:hypothetical protein
MMIRMIFQLPIPSPMVDDLRVVSGMAQHQK